MSAQAKCNPSGSGNFWVVLLEHDGKQWHVEQRYQFPTSGEASAWVNEVLKENPDFGFVLAERIAGLPNRILRTWSVPRETAKRIVTIAKAENVNPSEASKGVKFVLGILNKAGKSASEVQSVLFEKAKWTVADAKKWLKEQGFKVPTVDDAKNFFRFRQTSPKKYKEMRTIEAGQHENPGKAQKTHITGLCRAGQHDKCAGVFHRMGGGGACVCPCHQRTNPESIPSSLIGHLALTSDPFFQQQPPEIQAAMMTGMDLAERVQNPIRNGFDDPTPSGWGVTMGRSHAGEVIAGNKPGMIARLSDQALYNLARYFFDHNKEQWGFQDNQFTSFARAFKAAYRDRLEEHKRKGGKVFVEQNPMGSGPMETRKLLLIDVKFKKTAEGLGRIIGVARSQGWTEVEQAAREKASRLHIRPDALEKHASSVASANPYGSKPWEQIGYHLGHTRGGQDRAAVDVNLHVSTDYGDIRKQAEWHIDNQLKLQPGYRESYRPHIVSAFVNGWHDGYTRRKPKMKKPNPAYGQVKGRGWMQESYESASGDARKRASELRKLGYRVGVSSMGPQVTPVGTVRMTMVNIGPGSTGDEYLENVPETRVVRLNPSAASDAAALSEAFHGRPAQSVTTLTEDMVERVDFMEVGDLVELKVRTPSGYDVVLQFPPKGRATVKLCASPDGKQLYFRGGDQKVPLDQIHMGAEKWKRDKMVLGELRETVYRAQKKFDGFKTYDYAHKNSEVSKKYPVLIYDTLNDQLEVAGGTGFITWRGLED